MPNKSIFDVAVPRRGTNSIKWDTVPDGVIPMSIADTDWATAPAVVDAIRAKLDGNPVFGYSLGDPSIADSVVAWYSRKYGFTVEKDWIVVIPGIVPALAELANVAEGDVLAQTPNYAMLLSAPARVGKTLRRVPLIETVTDGILSYETDFDALEKQADGAGLFYLCNPHNPIGKVYSREELAQLARFAKSHNLVVVSDEIHGELVYGKAHTPYIAADGGLENSILLTAAGKICNMPGLHGAVAVVPDEKLREKVKAIYPRAGLGALDATGFAAAYSPEADAWKDALTEYLAENRDYLETELKRRLPKLRFPHNDGTYLLWLDFTAYGIENPQKFLLEKARVALTDGVGFGGTQYHARLNFGCPRSTLTEALGRVESALNT
ncbi:MAG: aminotransferase class I/II-fold pyridoxal phosphate-dependent enzyme [Oscillospiraceae bacterium]|jgi:cystathionine beta-lyase|nr:aminotransferase class I/II-fold pyridoxal phosphate-dependent enzyme [Oscillospiraceae bacterium]